MKLIFNTPINDLSFGNVGLNILREFYKQQDKVVIFPIGDPNFSAYDKIDKDFAKWINNSIKYRFHNLNKDYPTLTLWHLNGSEKFIGKNNTLFTFHELDDLTFSEKKVSEFQDNVLLSNPESVSIFKENGLNNVKQLNIGFDPDFHVIDKEIVKGKVHFTLSGKFEKRKHTKEIIKSWLKKFGNDNRYMLSCCITNPFLKEEQQKQLLASILDNKHYSNINFIPRLKTNSEVNHFLNSSHIDLTGLSGGEGWNLPAFNATCLGKWSIVCNHSGHKAWATKDNSILIEPDEKEDVYDGLFFSKGSNWNQGRIYKFNEAKAVSAMEKAISMHGNINQNGLKTAEKFTYEKTVKKIKEIIKNG